MKGLQLFAILCVATLLVAVNSQRGRGVRGGVNTGTGRSVREAGGRGLISDRHRRGSTLGGLDERKRMLTDVLTGS